MTHTVILSDGTEIFCKSVKGVKPMLWIQKGVDAAQPAVQTLLAENGRAMIDFIKEQVS